MSLCPTCAGSHLDPNANPPAVCLDCNGSGTTTRIGAPVGVLVRAAEGLWDTAAHDPDHVLAPGEERGLYAQAGRLYAAAAALRARGTHGRAELAALSYQSLDAADMRAEGRRILDALGYTERQREIRGWMVVEAVGGVQ